tara:strand:+ start:544 stop:747 length:204 start_codon:yes stop_codon:yes gene_type:complete
MKKNNPLLETVRITREQLNDYQMMENFIYDNAHTTEFMLYEQLINEIKQQQLRDNDVNATPDDLRLN